MKQEEEKACCRVENTTEGTEDVATGNGKRKRKTPGPTEFLNLAA